MIKKIRIEEKAIVQNALSFLIGHHLQSAGVSQALAWVIALNMTSLHSLFIKKKLKIARVYPQAVQT